MVPKVSWSNVSGRANFSINERDSGFMEDKGASLKDADFPFMGYFNSSHPHYKARLDQVKMYNTATVKSSELIGRWDLDEGSGT